MPATRHGIGASVTAVCLAACLGAGAGLARAESATYAIDPTHTFVHFEALHAGTSTLRGRFDRKGGSVTIDRAARTGQATIEIDTGSLSTGVGALDSRLKSKDFLGAADFPKATFVGDRFGFEGDQPAAVSGTLTLAGHSQPVTLKATRFNCYLNPLLRREVCGGDFETTLQPSAFGMRPDADFGMPDLVRLRVQIEGVRQ